MIMNQIIDLYKKYGDTEYFGESVSKTTHMIQAALSAEKNNEPDYLILACLLHDIGHFLDDDNIVNPNFYKLLRDIKVNYFYTFDQQRNRYVFSGENPKVYHIDLGMFLFDFKLASDIRFRLDKYEADGIYVEECCNKDIKKHI